MRAGHLRDRVLRRSSWRWEPFVHRIAGSRYKIDLPDSVALTFDDGPDPVFTPQILDILRRNGVRATFFVVGDRALRYPSLVAAMTADGHQVGSHTYSHRNLRGASTYRVFREIRDGRRGVEKVIGRRSDLFRPPQGAVGLRSALLARLLGCRSCMWSRGGEDWMAGMTPEGVLRQFEGLEGGDVVLLHDCIADADTDARDRSSTVQAVETLVQLVKDRGFSFATLS